jgi:hypothetical protein
VGKALTQKEVDPYMPEDNGTGRLDRIETLLLGAADKIEKIATTAYLHDEHLWQIELSLEEMIQVQKDLGHRFDELGPRFDELGQRFDL